MQERDKFVLKSKYQPTGDQPKAIKELVESIRAGHKEQTLLGVTGSGKTFTMANVIAELNRPTLVLAHNKTLAAQLAPQGGTVLLDGQSLSVYSPNARARKMALMVPHTNRTELTTCFDVAAAGRYPYTGRLGILSEEDKKQVFDALHLVNAADIADRDFDKISDGQRQRGGIANQRVAHGQGKIKRIDKFC